MKIIITGLLIGFFTFSAFADTLNCTVDNRFRNEGTILEGDVGLEIKTVAFCDNDDYRVTIHGGGIGLYGIGASVEGANLKIERR